MNAQERGLLAALFTAIIVIVAIDLATDWREGVPQWHLLAEALVAIFAALGIVLLLKDAFALRRLLAQERSQAEEWKVEAEKWRRESSRHVRGLSEAIEAQLNKWHLSGAEKEVAFLLLKGLSLKEVAEVRRTTEKTARLQSAAIYAKAGLGGRSELAAFFLEDLLLPAPSSP